jgi:hypothetical protein
VVDAPLIADAKNIFKDPVATDHKKTTKAHLVEYHIISGPALSRTVAYVYSYVTNILMQ